MRLNKISFWSLIVWNVLNLLDALTTFWVLKFEKVYDVNQIVGWLNDFGRSYVFIYFIIVAILINLITIYSFKSEIKNYITGALLFYSFIILLATIGNVVLIYEWIY